MVLHQSQAVRTTLTSHMQAPTNIVYTRVPRGGLGHGLES